MRRAGFSNEVEMEVVNMARIRQTSLREVLFGGQGLQFGQAEVRFIRKDE
jgi:hypothetical protein